MSCLQECWISDQAYSLNIQLPGYECIIQGKSSSDRGGLITYVDKKFKYEVSLNLNMYEHWEGQIIYLKGGGLPKPIIIGNIYRPPRMLRDQIKQFINEFTSLILSLDKLNRSINIAGDYNLNLLKINENGMCSEFFDLLTSHSLFPQITLPTRFSHTSGTLIDNVFCKVYQTTKATTAGILLNKLSDHQPYFVLLDIALTKIPNPNLIKIHLENDEAINKFINEISSADLYNKLDKSQTAYPNVSYNIIHDEIEKAKNKHMLCKLVKFNKYKHKKSKWITRGLLNSIRFRDNLYKRMKLTNPTSREYEIIYINIKTYNKI